MELQMPERRMAALGGLHESGAYQRHTLNKKYQDACQNMYKALTAQYYKPYILLPYNIK
jgi:hypothetical protein